MGCSSLCRSRRRCGDGGGPGEEMVLVWGTELGGE